MSGRAVLCAGRLYCDLVFTGAERLPTLGTETFARGLGLHAGGGAFITAAYLRALGRSAALVATLPAEPFRGPVLGDIARCRVDASRCRAAPAGTDPQVTVAMAIGEDRAFLTRAAGPALPPLTLADLAGAGHLHIGELRTLADLPWLVDLAREAGMTISLDCGWDDDLNVDMAALVARVDVFLPNEREAERLAAMGLDPQIAPLTVVKCGAKGAFALRAAERITAPGCKADLVDATGAGDAFNGGFLDAWLSQAPLEACLAAGNRCGALAVSARGGTGAVAALTEAATPALHGQRG